MAIARQDLGVDHVLHDVGVLPIGRRIDNDDVLFATTDPAKPFVLVHLTLAIQPETNSAHAEVFTGWQDWVDRSMIPDHVRYCGKYLFTVKIAPFPIANRGLVVESNRSSIEWLSSMRIGSSLMLLRNGMPPLATNVKGTETLNHANPEHPLCILLDGNLDRADVPIGTEVWLVDAEDRP